MEVFFNSTPLSNASITDDCDYTLSALEIQQSMYNPYRSMQWIMVIAVPLILICGVGGNMAFLLVLYRVPQMRNDTNFYLGNLAIADVSYLVIAGTRYLIAYGRSPVMFLSFPFYTNIGCALPTYLVNTSYFASVWLVTLVAAERYLAICRPMRHMVIRAGKRRAVKLVILAWLSAGIMAAFAAPFGPGLTICVRRQHVDDVILVFTSCAATCRWCGLLLQAIDCVQFNVAFWLNLFLYSRIILTLNSRPSVIDYSSSSVKYKTSPAASSATMATTTTMMKRHVIPKRSSSDIKMYQDRNQVARMLVVNVLVFFLCLFPFSVVYNLTELLAAWSGGDYSFLLTQEQSRWMSWVGKLTALINSAVNPFIYSMCNRRYRMAFQKGIRCCRNS